LLQALVAAAAGRRLALVGGVVRDLLLHRVHNDPWRGLPDLDLVVEGTAAEIAADAPDQCPALALAEALRSQLGPDQVPAVREHGCFGTVELEVELRLPEAGTWLLDIASARQESYPAPGENPIVQLGRLEDDLARRDFSVNAIALLLDADGPGLHLLDPHHGQADLAMRQLRLFHPHSLRDDPTRLLRGARYAARLGFSLSSCSLRQARTTLAAWPWGWHPGDPPQQAPPALGTRLRMELELLLEREPWLEALSQLQSWGGLALLDAQLQRDQHWRRRLHWAQRFQLPRPAALLAGAADPLAVAERLQLPHRQQRLLCQWLELRTRLRRSQPLPDRPSAWCRLLEAAGGSSDAVALALANGDSPRGPLLRWWLHWRHVKAPITAAELIAAGLPPGPALGTRLQQARADLLDALPNRRADADPPES
jgi:poly(A) polymerase